MEHTLNLLSAFVIGFLGSLHCVAMCGGISGALTSATVNTKKINTRLYNQNKLIYPVLYSTGRISSYMVAGAIAGTSGLIISGSSNEGASALRIFAGIMTILLGVYICGWKNLLAPLEKGGKKVWNRLSPLTGKLIPVDSSIKALSLGALWGWLPCGLVYSALTWSIGSSDPARGALLMGCFGLGTLPAIIATGLFGSRLFSFASARSSRIIAGMVIIAFGSWTITATIYHSYGRHEAGTHHNKIIPHQHEKRL